MAADDSSGRVVDLEDTGWARLLFALLSQRFTGRAELQQAGCDRIIVFRGGFAVWTDFETPGTGVSKILCSAGMLDATDAEAVLAKAPADSLDAWDVLEEQGVVDAETVVMALRDQCERRLVAAASIRSGPLVLYDQTGLDQDVLDGLSPARTLRAINHAVRAYTSPDQAHEAMAELEDKQLCFTPGYAKHGARFGFVETERELLTLLEQRGTFALDELLHISAFDSVRGSQLLFTLWACGMLVEADSFDLSAEQSFPGQAPRAPVLEMLGAKIEAGSSPFEVLSLGSSATLAEIEAAFERLDLKIQEANDTELAIALRDVYKAARGQRWMSASSTGKRALSDRRWKRAVASLADVVELNPDDAESKLDLAWARWNAEDQREAEARVLEAEIRSMLDAQDLVRERARAYFYRGHLRKQQGRRREAIDSFERAAALDERLLDAQREARALGANKDAPAPARSAKKTPAKSSGAKQKDKAPRSKYWSGAWPVIWVLTGLLFAGLLAAQVILRLDIEL